MTPGQRLLVRRDDVAQTRLEPFDAAAAPLDAGQARLRVDAFALTANNVTYAVFGDTMDYWRFFPADDGWGCIPVWGFATVEASACDGLDVGERCYGFWPMASHATVEPAGVGAGGFVDGSAHRAALPAVYNRYQRVPREGDPQREALTAVLRPLFTTAWLIADFLDEHDDFGAQAALLSSASSKTAIATAFCLSRRRGRALGVVGATSPARHAFCEGLALYDSVVDYGALPTLAADEPTLYIDFAGDMAFRRAVHEHWRDRLVYSGAVGVTHHDARAPTGPMPGPRPQFFFAPARVQQRGAPPPQGLGRAALLQHIDAAWADFAERADTGAQTWLRVERHVGAPAVQQAYLAMLHGRVDPAVGLVLRF